jgi:multiple sugar transport system permease protein
MADRPQGPVGVGAAATVPVPPVVATRGRWSVPRRIGAYKQALFVLLLIVLSIIFVYPFIWLISASLKPQGETFDNKLIPDNFVEPWYANFTDVMDRVPLATWFINSVWISGLGALLVTFSSALVAFAFAYFEFPGRTALFAIVIGTMMLPGAVTMIPTYLIWTEIGDFTEAHSFLPHIGVNTQYPLWVPNMFGSAFYIFLQRQFFLGIPRQLFEAARIDGDNYFTMFWRIALPLAKPALIVTFIFEIQAKWFDLITPLIYLTDDKLATLPLGIKFLLDRYGPGGGGEGEWNIIVAGTVILVVPMVIIFAIFQRYFVSGITTQGTKG